MTGNYKPGDKVWLKAVVMQQIKPTPPSVAVQIVHPFGPVGHLMHPRDIRRRVKRKAPASAWQTIETAPKDGTWVFVHCAFRSADEESCPVAIARWGKGYKEFGFWGESWRVDGNVDLGWHPNPTHWLPLPPLLEVVK